MLHEILTINFAEEGQHVIRTSVPNGAFTCESDHERGADIVHIAADVFVVRGLYADAFAQFRRGYLPFQARVLDQPFHHFAASDLVDVEPGPIGRKASGCFLIIQRQNSAGSAHIHKVVAAAQYRENKHKGSDHDKLPSSNQFQSAFEAFPSFSGNAGRSCVSVCFRFVYALHAFSPSACF